MSAMTEMPANTPSPIGSTESCLPGSANAAAAVWLALAVESAALAADVVATDVVAPVETAETGMKDEPCVRRQHGAVCNQAQDSRLGPRQAASRR
jgi:hypothetical protein